MRRAPSVISARGPNEREMDAVTRMVPEIKEKYGLKVCACLGLLQCKDNLLFCELCFFMSNFRF